MAKTRTKRGPVSTSERTRYRARIENDAEWGRPTETTAGRVCELFHVDPATLRTPRDHDDKVAAQAFAVALDWVIRLGERSEARENEFGEFELVGARMTFNGLFDALAPFWSIRYCNAKERGATVSYEMSEATLTGDDDCVWRELQAAGVNVEAIWALLIRQTRPPRKPPKRLLPPPHRGLARLYTLRRVPGRGYSPSRKVQLHEDQLLDDVRYAILRDPQYERPVTLRLLRAEDKVHGLPTRQSVCEERPYDVVDLGKRSKGVLAILEKARLRFYVERFREDFEALDEFRLHQPRPHRSMRIHRCGYDRVEQTVRGLRSVYEQTAGLANLPRDSRGRAYVVIRSRFFRSLNRRFNAHDFWPEQVAGDLRERWFGADEVGVWVPGNLRLGVDEDEVEFGIDDDDAFEATIENEFIERDISSSQTQVLAVFLGLPDLEALATDSAKKFKVWLAERLWAFHKSTPGGALSDCSDGYKNERDDRLIAFIKELWMRRNYGGEFGKTVRSLARDPVTYGPGWNSNVFAAGGVKRAEGYWDRFLDTLPQWSDEVTRFLKACQYIGGNADPERGVVFTDPLDGAEVRWNPIRRAPKKLPAGKSHYIEARLPGRLSTDRKTGKKRFISTPWRVDTRTKGKLARRIAPCVIHTLDAFFNALVVEDLHAAGIEQLVAIHDSWFLPDFLSDFVETGLYDDTRSGEVVLWYVIEDAGREWLKGLSPVYNWFVTALTGSPYEDLATSARDRWRQRVAEQRWPRFMAS